MHRNDGTPREGRVPAGPPDSFSTIERRFLGPARRTLAVMLRPAVRLLAALGVSPNAVSSAQIIGALAFWWVVPIAPRLALAMFLGTLVLDALDGALARHTGRSSTFGRFFDQLCDYARESIVIVALAAIGVLSGPLAGLYVFTYGAFNATLFLANRYGTPVTVAVKSYVVLYPALIAYLWAGINWLDAAVALSTGMMIVVLLAALPPLQRAMDK